VATFIAGVRPSGFRFAYNILPLVALLENMVFSALTAARILYHQIRLKKLRNALPMEDSSPYTGIVVMIVESASLNIIFQLLVIIVEHFFWQKRGAKAVFDLLTNGLLCQIQASKEPYCIMLAINNES
jgi:hypothetical protein